MDIWERYTKRVLVTVHPNKNGLSLQVQKNFGFLIYFNFPFKSSTSYSNLIDLKLKNERLEHFFQQEYVIKTIQHYDYSLYV
jgi:hypothetical protein